MAMLSNNFDATNLLLEHGADSLVENDEKQNSLVKLILSDHKDLLECVFPLAVRYHM
jgi:ankyrin repeat protein